MGSKRAVPAVCILAMLGSLVTGAQATAADPATQSQGPAQVEQGAPAPSPSAAPATAADPSNLPIVPLMQSQGRAQVEQGAPAPSPSASVADPVENLDKRLGTIEEWKAKIERLPSLSNKFNIGLNALQFLYTHQDAHVAEGKSQDNLSIRRSEVLMYGKINEYIPKWHTLMEMQSNNLTNNTPGCAASKSL